MVTAYPAVPGSGWCQAVFGTALELRKRSGTVAPGGARCSPRGARNEKVVGSIPTGGSHITAVFAPRWGPSAAAVAGGWARSGQRTACGPGRSPLVSRGQARIAVLLGGLAVASPCGGSGHHRCGAVGCARAAGAP